MILRLFLLLYSALFTLLLPVLLIYLYRRGRRDPDYSRHLGERFGIYKTPAPQNPIWLHAVSLGEARSAYGLIRLILDRGDTVVLTHFTPAARRESERHFGDDIQAGRLAVIWVPLDLRWCYRRFFRAFKPRIGLPLEVEVWPNMIFAAKHAGIPLYLCNAQYSEKSFKRDDKGARLRQKIIRNCAGAFVKSDGQKARFDAIGLENVHVTGELRFDLPVPQDQLAKAQAFKHAHLGGRNVIAIPSGKPDEEPLFQHLILRHIAQSAARDTDPLFVYVPRAPERFAPVAQDLSAAGLRVAKRSTTFRPDLDAAHPNLDDVDVLVGDSLGEMFFYLSLSDSVVIGGSFNPRGAHNIIEPLIVAKPCLTGPYVWTIEFPFYEAEAAGVAKQVPDIDALLAELAAPPTDLSAPIDAFLARHIGASARTLAEIDRVTGRAS